MKTEHLAAATALAGAAALGTFFALGVMPDARGDTCTVSTARGPCEAAKLLGADPDDCALGTQIYRRIEQKFAPDAGEGGTLPLSFTVVPESTVKVPCASLRRPSKALTSRKPRAAEGCIVGEWQGWDGRAATARCCGPSCTCAGRCVPTVPVVIAGADPTGEELCSVVPEHGSCDAGPP